MVSSPARTGARPNLRRRILRTTLFGLASSAAASASVAVGDDLGTLGFAFDDGAGLGFGDGLFGLGGVLLAEAGLVPVGGDGFVDDDLGLAVEAGAVVDLGVDEGERDLGHAGGLAVAGAGEDDVFHLDAAEGLGGLLAENPGDGVGDVGLAAAVGADDGGDAFAGELDLGAITEGLEAEYLNLLELEQMRPLWAKDWGGLAYSI